MCFKYFVTANYFPMVWRVPLH